MNEAIFFGAAIFVAIVLAVGGALVAIALHTWQGGE
jgi:hypothetical protein